MLTQALLFINVVDVDPRQLTALIAVCVTGGWIGAGVVASLSRRAVQLGMGGALLVAAAFMMLSMLGQFPTGGTALAFTPRAFALALVVNFVLGALLPLGIGKPNPLVNEFYRRALRDSSIDLTIVTALSLLKPVARSALEARLLAPLAARVFGTPRDRRFGGFSCPVT